jgi:hypothetical protein
MRDQTVHAIDPQSKDRKTHCGIGSFGKQVSTHGNLITCGECRDAWYLENVIAPKPVKEKNRVKSVRKYVSVSPQKPTRTKKSGGRKGRGSPSGRTGGTPTPG